jgi:sarcosine oxidase
MGLLEPGGGFVRPEATINAAVADACKHGALLRTRTSVQNIQEDHQGVHLTTDRGEIRCKRLIVCAGAWSQKLLPQIATQLQVTRQLQAWITTPNPAAIQPEQMPAWFLVRDNEPALYGIPADPLVPGTPAAKIAIHGRPEKADPDNLTRTVSPDERKHFQALAKRWLPRLAATVTEAKVCMYTMTPDENFLVDRAPGMEHTWFAAGLSGHGFKLTPALGQVLSDLALDGTSDLPAEFLRLRKM